MLTITVRLTVGPSWPLRIGLLALVLRMIRILLRVPLVRWVALRWAPRLLHAIEAGTSTRVTILVVLVICVLFGTLIVWSLSPLPASFFEAFVTWIKRSSVVHACLAIEVRPGVLRPWVALGLEALKIFTVVGFLKLASRTGVIIVAWSLDCLWTSVEVRLTVELRILLLMSWYVSVVLICTLRVRTIPIGRLAMIKLLVVLLRAS